MSDVGYKSVLGAALLQGAEEMGYKNRDCNGEFQTGHLFDGVGFVYKDSIETRFLGFMHAQGTVRRDYRLSTNKAFLRPIRFRSNLHVTTKSFVTKIIFDESKKMAVGVHFEKNGKVYEIRARKEVILSAGSVASPQILMVNHCPLGMNQNE